MKLIFGLFFALVLSFDLQAADFNTTCTSFSPPLSGGFCVHVPTGPRSRDIVYHLHGLGGSQADWQDPWYYTEQIRQEWSHHRVRKPTVVSVSLGTTWLLVEQNASPYSGLFEVFTQQIIPTIERSLGGLRGRRIIFGESMGGLNTAQLALKTNLFNKAAILCAPMTEVSPFAAIDEIRAHINNSAAQHYWEARDPDFVFNTLKDAITLAKAFTPTPADFAKSNPLELATTTRTRTEMYITAGFYDQYALYEGNEEFVRRLSRRVRSIEWHPMWGGHCVMDIPSLARFLIER